MKPVTLTIGALAIALVCGSGGYFVGKNQAATVRPAGGAIQDREPAARSSGTSNRSGVQPVDLPGLRARLDAETNPLARFKLALQSLETWVAKNPVDALDWLASQPRTERREDVIQMALKQFAETDAKGAAAWAMKNLSGVDLNNTLITIAENWAQENGAEAAAWFLALPVTEERNAAAENIFFSWAANEPAAALEFLKSNPGYGDLNPTLFRAALAGWAKTDPQGAVAASLALSKTHNDPAQFANTLANWATMDLEASSQWLLSNLTAGTERTIAAQELATIFADQSPESGIAWLGKLSAGAERDTAASSLVATWSRSAPADATKWAAAQDSIHLAPEAVAVMARNFLMKDAAAFEAWRATLPNGPLKEQVGKVGVMSEDE
ncbi:MAG: hypothetical protein V4584_11120 [Verrucomicrobiota bacterium]